MSIETYAAAQEWLRDIGYPVVNDLIDTTVAINALYHGGLDAFIADERFTEQCMKGLA